MSQLPCVANARLADAKVTSYLLSATHPVGAAKAKFFVAHGFSLADWQTLRAALLAHPQNNPVANQIANQFGIKYEVNCSIDGTAHTREASAV
jgi:hypothetical protein